jgi:hypothetical protein
MNEQDGEYYSSLIADKEKQEKKQEEEREAREKAELDKILETSQTTAAEDEKRRVEEAERRRIERKEALPAEPTPVKRAPSVDATYRSLPCLPAFRSGSDGSDTIGSDTSGGSSDCQSKDEGVSAPLAALASPTAAPPTVAAAVAGSASGVEPATGADSVVTLSFRLPRSSKVKRLERRFRTSDNLQVLYSCCTHAVLVLYSCCTHAVLVLYSCCTHALLMLYSCCTRAVLVLYSYCRGCLTTSTATRTLWGNNGTCLLHIHGR